MITKKFFIVYTIQEHGCMPLVINTSRNDYNRTTYIHVYMVIGAIRKHSHMNPQGFIIFIIFSQ